MERQRKSGLTMEIVALTPDYLDALLGDASASLQSAQLARAYFSPGSVSCCILVDGEPVFAGGIVSLQWNRGEVWILPTRFFRSHVKSCFQAMRKNLPGMVAEGGFRRIQATCVKGSPSAWLRLFGFTFEGEMRAFGPNGEDCSMFSRIFEESV
jgi:hypothetical protein